MTGKEYKVCQVISTCLSVQLSLAPIFSTRWKWLFTHDGIQQALLLLRRNRTCLITCAIAYEQTSIAKTEATFFIRSMSHWRRCSKDLPVKASSPHKNALRTQRDTI